MTSRGVLLALSAAGLAFSGYLSGINLFTETCAFNEPCPYFLGYPACWYGFAMYLAMFAIALHAVLTKAPHGRPERGITAIAALGTLFSGYFAVQEIAAWFGPEGFVAYSLGLPTCVYGLIFYVAILIIGSRSLRKAGRAAPKTREREGSAPPQNAV